MIMRRFLLVFVCGILLSACTTLDNSDQKNDANVGPAKIGELELHLAQVLLKDNSSYGYDSNLEFDL